MMRRRYGIPLAALLALAACTSPRPPPAQATSPSPKQDMVASIWAYHASAYPSMCIIFLKDGRVEFRGGFLAFNPGHWEHKPNSSKVLLRLGGDAPFPIDVIKYQKRNRPHSLAAYDERKRLLVYRVDEDTESIDFMNFIFYRDSHCDAATPSM